MASDFDFDFDSDFDSDSDYDFSHIEENDSLPDRDHCTVLLLPREDVSGHLADDHEGSRK